MIQYNSINTRIWARLGACGTFGQAAMDFPEINNKIVVLAADMRRFAGLDRFEQVNPDMFINCGIAEQNMIGMAAGFAKEGYVPFAISYAVFVSSRAADFVRVNMGYMKLPIKLIGLAGGFTAGQFGATHVAVEDIAIMRAIPGITVISPADCTEVVKAVIATAQTNEPTYIRICGIPNLPIVYKQDFDFEIGKAITLREGNDIAIIATGTMVSRALEAANELEKRGVSARVINMHTIKPLDKDAIMECTSLKLIITVEEHSIIGGLGAAVAEVLSGIRNTPAQIILGIRDTFNKAASYEYQLGENGLLAEQIVNAIINALKSAK
jgi:transketolase